MIRRGDLGVDGWVVSRTVKEGVGGVRNRVEELVEGSVAEVLGGPVIGRRDVEVSFRIEGEVNDIKVDPNGRYIVVAGSKGGEVVWLDNDGEGPKGVLSRKGIGVHAGPSLGVDISPDGERIIVSDGSRVYVVNVEGLSIVSQKKGSELFSQVVGVKWFGNREGGVGFVAITEEEVMVVRDEKKIRLKIDDSTGRNTAMAVLPEKDLIAVARGGKIHLFRWIEKEGSAQVVRGGYVTFPVNVIEGMKFSDDGKKLAITLEDSVMIAFFGEEAPPVRKLRRVIDGFKRLYLLPDKKEVRVSKTHFMEGVLGDFRGVALYGLSFSSPYAVRSKNGDRPVAVVDEFGRLAKGPYVACTGPVGFDESGEVMWASALSNTVLGSKKSGAQLHMWEVGTGKHKVVDITKDALGKDDTVSGAFRAVDFFPDGRVALGVMGEVLVVSGKKVRMK